MLKSSVFTRLPVVLLILAVALPLVARDRESSLIKAFGAFLRVSELAPEESLVVSQVPCSNTTCLQLEVAGVARDKVLRNFVSLVTGFGVSADVSRLLLQTSPEDFNKTTLRLTVAESGQRLNDLELKRRAENCMTVLSSLSRLSSPGSGRFSPEKTGPADKVYLLYRLILENGGQTGSAELLFPPQAPPPLPAATVSDCVRWSGGVIRPFAGEKFEGWNIARFDFSRSCDEVNE